MSLTIKRASGSTGHTHVLGVERKGVTKRNVTGDQILFVDIQSTKELKSQIALLRAESVKTLPYIHIFEQALFSQSELVKQGLAAWVVKSLAKDLDLDQTALVECLGIARSTYSRKLREKKFLGISESERVLGVARLIGQVQSMVEQSGDPNDFDAKQWVGQWLEQPLPALNNRAPLEMLDTASGQELVSQLLMQVQSGAYA